MSFQTEIKEGFIISVKALLANKMRALLTMLGIIIGIVSVTLMSTAIEGLNRSFAKSIESLGADVLYVQKMPWFSGEDWMTMRNRPNIKWEHVRAIEKQSTLALAVAPQVGTSRNVKYGGKIIENVSVLGTNEQFLAAGGGSLSAGRFFTEQESEGARPVTVIGSTVAENLFAFQNPIGMTVTIGGNSYRVVGVLEKQGSFLGAFSLDNRVYVPLYRFQNQFGSQRSITIGVRTPSIEQLDEAQEELRGIMRKARRLEPGKEDNFAINRQEMFQRTFDAIGAVIAGVGLFITGLSLFVGSIGIMNIMFVSVTERTREIGIRKAVGAPRRAILLQFLLEAILICLVGGVVALMISYPLSLIVDQVLPTSMPLSIVGVALAISTIVGLVSGLIPAYRAAKIDPVDALRYE